jgi:hypothetical protein
MMTNEDAWCGQTRKYFFDFARFTLESKKGNGEKMMKKQEKILAA